MNLSKDICRCMGLLPAPNGEQRCARRDSCARFVQRHEGGERISTAQWLCPTTDDYYGRYIEQLPARPPIATSRA